MVVVVVVVVVEQSAEAGIFVHNSEAYESKAYSGNNQPECYRSRMLFCVCVVECQHYFQGLQVQSSMKQVAL